MTSSRATSTCSRWWCVKVRASIRVSVPAQFNSDSLSRAVEGLAAVILRYMNFEC